MSQLRRHGGVVGRRSGVCQLQVLFCFASVPASALCLAVAVAVAAVASAAPAEAPAWLADVGRYK
jgi:hypothetical protein